MSSDKTHPWLPLGAADPAAGVGYIGEPAGTVAAFQLGDGTSRWRAEAAARPVAAGPGWVILAALGGAGAPGVLQLQSLDAASGEITGRAALDLGITAQSLTDLDLSARVTADGLELGWRHRGGYRGGAPPSREVEERFSRQRAGALRYAPGAGGVERLATGVLQPPLESFPYRQAGRWREQAWSAAGAVARLALGRDRGGELRLESWPQAVTSGVSGAPMRDEVVWQGEEVEPSVTAAGGHLLLRRTRPPGRSWRVVTVPGGEPAGEVPWREGDQWPEVLGGRVYHLASAGAAGLLLRAVELASGRQLWHRDLAPATGPRRAPPPPPG